MKGAAKNSEPNSSKLENLFLIICPKGFVIGEEMKS